MEGSEVRTQEELSHSPSTPRAKACSLLVLGTFWPYGGARVVVVGVTF